MNSCTSRPRSPIRAMTLTSLSPLRASMPRKVLLPTPLPANTPIRWPRPQVSMPSSTRTPVTRGVVMGRRRNGCEARPAPVTVTAAPRMGGPSSMGTPRPSTTRPSSSPPTVTRAGAPVAMTRLPGVMPAASPKIIVIARSPRKPTTWQRTGLPSPRVMTACSPMAAASPATSTVSPTIWLTVPDRSHVRKDGTHAVKRGKALVRCGVKLLMQKGPNLVQLRVERGVHAARAALYHAAARGYGYVAYDSHRQRRRQPQQGNRRREQLLVARMNAHRHRRAQAQLFQGRAGDAQDRIRCAG